MVDSGEAAFEYHWQRPNSFFREVMDRLHDYAVVITDLEGDVQYWNDGARDAFGYRSEEIRGRSIQLLFVPEDRSAGVDAKERLQAATNQRVTDERWMLRQDGTRCFVSSMVQRIRADTFEGYVRIMRDETHRPNIGELGLGAPLVGTLPELHQWSQLSGNKGPEAWAAFLMTPLEEEAQQKSQKGARAEVIVEGRPLAVLLVEDHEDTARLMSRLLSRYRHYVTIAPTVAAAKELVETRRFDVLISDIGLPDGTGFDVVRLAKAAQPIPCIALTGFGMEEDAARSAEAGFDAHLVKPLDFRKLELLLRKIGGAG